MNLRPYQAHCVEQLYSALAKEPRVLCVMGTGMGKTETFIALAKKASVKTVVIVGRNKLVEQTVRRMRAVFDDVGVWSAGQGEKRVAPITVVSIHSADSLTIPDLRFIICDEAHNLNDGRYKRFLDRHPTAKLAGFTATPWRDGVEIFGEGRIFPRVNFRRSILTGIEDGFLVPPISKAMPDHWQTKGLKISGDDFKLSDITRLVSDSAKIKKQVADAMPRLEGRHKIVWICASIEHAENVAKCIPEMSCIIHSKQNQELNDYQIECFERGEIRHMVSVMMLSEGYDYPAIDAIVLMRPTRSPTLYVQCVGRGLRPASGKKNCLVLDYGEVIANCGPIHDPLTRNMRAKGQGKEKLEITMRVCPKCLSYVQGDVCQDCGHEMKIERDPVRSLKTEASSADILAMRKPERFVPRSLSASQYKSKAGNECIRLEFLFDDRVAPFYVYISSHPFSWNKGRRIIETFTPWNFSTWQECYDACEELVFSTPEWIELGKSKNGYEELKGISDRGRDFKMASQEQDGVLLEEHF